MIIILFIGPTIRGVSSQGFGFVFQIASPKLKFQLWTVNPHNYAVTEVTIHREGRILYQETT